MIALLPQILSCRGIKMKTSFQSKPTCHCCWWWWHKNASFSSPNYLIMTVKWRQAIHQSLPATVVDSDGTKMLALLPPNLTHHGIKTNTSFRSFNTSKVHQTVRHASRREDRNQTGELCSLSNLTCQRQDKLSRTCRDERDWQVMLACHYRDNCTHTHTHTL